MKKVLLLAASLLAASFADAAEQNIFPYGPATGPYFLCDDRVVEDRWLVERFAVPPTRYSDAPILTRDKPWEGTGPHSGGAVLFDPDQKKYLMWYSVWNSHAYYNKLPFSYNVCYAESTDGLVWTKPSLGVFDYEGSKDNNIIKLGTDKTQNIDVCFNPKPGVYPGKFLALHNQKGGLFISHSDDGKTFTFLQEAPAISYHSDTHNNFEYDEVRDHWFLYCRPRAYAGYHKRRVSIVESDDLRTWTHDRTILVPTETDIPEFYGMVVFRRGDLFFGLLQRYVKATGFMDCELAWSSDGTHWQQIPTHAAFAGRGPEGAWDHGMTLLESPVFVDDEIRFYYGGAPLPHDTKEENVWGVGLMKSERDRLIGLRPSSSEEGVILTRPFNPSNAKLAVNAIIRKSIHAELRTDNGKPIDGFKFDDCDPVMATGFKQPITWKGKQIADCAEPLVRVKFRLTDADLFTFQL
jgi:hypothetical protein